MTARQLRHPMRFSPNTRWPSIAASAASTVTSFKHLPMCERSCRREFEIADMAERVLSNTEEHQQIARKRAELKEFEARLAQVEPELATLQSQMRIFETRYLQVIGERYDELAEIEREI